MVAGLVCAYGVAPRTVVVFGGYVLGALVVPGTLLWRVFGPPARSLAEEVAAGTMLGYAVEVLGYLPARAVGLPALVLVAPGLTLAAFALAPGLRRHWSSQAGPVPGSWAWTVAGLTGLTIVATGLPFFRTHGLTWPGSAAPYIDMTFHLAVAAEVAHHVPPVIPYVAGQPLHTHWFFHVDSAAISNVTGIELQTLIFRLAPLPMLAAFVVLTAALAVRCAGRLWAGPAAAAAALLLGAPAPYGWDAALVPDALPLTGPAWTSPSLAFGAALFAAFLVALHGIFQAPRDRGPWLVAGVLLAAVLGAKATYLPLLGAGLLLAFAVASVRARRLYRTGLIALGAVGGYLLFAQFVFYGGASQGLRVEPLATVKAVPVALETHLVAPLPATPLLAALLGAAVLLLCHGAMWAGVAQARWRPDLLADPMMPVLLGIGAAGLGAILVFDHPGLSQLYFLQSARPCLAVAAVWAVAAWVWAAATGAAAVWAVRLATPRSAPAGAAAVVVPLLALAAVVLVVGRGRFLPVVLAGCCLATLPIRVERALTAPGNPPLIPRGAMSAGRWLRAHSRAGDLVATDLHCRESVQAYCDNRHFWVSAYTERRVLVEGWGYTDRVVSRSRRFDPRRLHYRAPFWNPALLAANDAVFRRPSAASVAVLRDRYHVRWLFTDHRVPGLSAYAELRRVSGRCAVYEVPRQGLPELKRSPTQ